MQKEWFAKLKQILEFASVLVTTLVTIAAVISPYLSDFWKGAALGALVAFFPILLLLVRNIFRPQLTLKEAQEIATKFARQQEAGSTHMRTGNTELKNGKWYVTGTWLLPAGYWEFEVGVEARSGRVTKWSSTFHANP